MIERWKCVGYCVHCSADQDESTFSEEWGHFEKSNDGCWVRADSAIARIATLSAEVMHYTAGTPHPRVTELEAALAAALETIKRLDFQSETSSESPWVITKKQAIEPTPEAADAFWKYWRENGESHRHGYYESTWGAINAALNASTDQSATEPK